MQQEGTQLFEKESGCIFCDRKAECFEFLKKEELVLFDKNKATISYKKGETIIKQGTQFTHVVSFNAGLAKINVELSSNKNIIIDILKPSEILGGPGMFADNRYSFTVTALTEAKICLINVDIFKKIIRTNETFAEKFLASFSLRYTQAINRLVNLSHKQMHGRVADALLYFSDSVFKADKFDLVLSRQELADFTGMSKESVSRILKELVTDDIVNVNGRLFEIKNKRRLTVLKESG